MTKKKTILLTGATGYIGRNFIEKYKDSYNIRPVDLRKTAPEAISFEAVDVVLHLAALVHQRKKLPREQYVKVNTVLTERLARCAKKNGVPQFVFYSTTAVYGSHGSLTERAVYRPDSPVNPRTLYAESKWLGEEILRQLETEDFRVAILRPPMVYGPGCPGNMRRLEKLVKWCPLLPFNFTENKRTLVEIDKLLAVTRAVIDREMRGIFIPKDEKDVSIKEIVEGIAAAQNINIRLFRLPDVLIRISGKIFPAEIESLYGDLRYEGEGGIILRPFDQDAI
ncbi:MAG: NAD-dependent epimerase/dehydratase family protein [Fusobacteriaceae bacterium]|jgi:UDP-glucose 4-epimerase|nr:NAD-dependent epimerase/dehydratase family protein [Fusobacteriaceae bacterium]